MFEVPRTVVMVAVDIERRERRREVEDTEEEEEVEELVKCDR